VLGRVGPQNCGSTGLKDVAMQQMQRCPFTGPQNPEGRSLARCLNLFWYTVCLAPLHLVACQLTAGESGGFCESAMYIGVYWGVRYTPYTLNPNLLGYPFRHTAYVPAPYVWLHLLNPGAAKLSCAKKDAHELRGAQYVYLPQSMQYLAPSFALRLA
jgi:hypothetical protein